MTHSAFSRFQAATIDTTDPEYEAKYEEMWADKVDMNWLDIINQLEGDKVFQRAVIARDWDRAAECVRDTAYAECPIDPVDVDEAVRGEL